MSFPEELSRAAAAARSPQPGEAGPPRLPGSPAGLIEPDHQSGRPCLKLPLPEPEVMQKILDVLGALLKR